MGIAISTLTRVAVPSKATIRVTRSQVSEYPDPRPSIHLYGDLGDHLRMIQPLELNWVVDEFDQHVISDDVSLMYGVGVTFELAMEDYKASLIDYFQILSTHQDAPTRRLFDHLCKFIQAK
jgi:hypothetical protein